MPRYDNSYSKLVAWLKIVLPLIALAILSTLFLVSQRTDPDRAIPYSDIEVAAILREQRIERPDYAGVAGDGTAITVAADSVRPETPERARAEGLRARLETPDGGILDLLAGAGLIDTAARRVDMSSGVRITTSSGYVIDTESVSSALDAADLRATGKIAASGPLGTFTAGEMMLRAGATEAGDGNGQSYVLVFKSGVRLLYRPQTVEGDLQ